MSRNNVIAKLEEIAELAESLPVGADVRIEWPQAPADLVLLVGLQDTATLTTEEHDGEIVERASWVRNRVSVVAEKVRPPSRGVPHLRLILGGKR